MYFFDGVLARNWAVELVVLLVGDLGGEQTVFPLEVPVVVEHFEPALVFLLVHLDLEQLSVISVVHPGLSQVGMLEHARFHVYCY